MSKMLSLNESNRRIGESHHRSKLTEDHITLIFKLRAVGFSYRQIAEKLDDIPGGVAKQTVCDVLTYSTWSHTTVRLKVSRPTNE